MTLSTYATFSGPRICRSYHHRTCAFCCPPLLVVVVDVHNRRLLGLYLCPGRGLLDLCRDIRRRSHVALVDELVPCCFRSVLRDSLHDHDHRRHSHEEGRLVGGAEQADRPVLDRCRHHVDDHRSHRTDR